MQSVEEKALIAAIREDTEELDKLLCHFSPSDLYDLAEAARRLAAAARRKRGELIADGADPNN